MAQVTTQAALTPSLTKTIILKTLGWAYDASLQGFPSVSSAQQLAQQYMRQTGSRCEQANALIRWQVAKVSASGFAAGLGGLLTLAITLPGDLAASYYIQLRMIAALACMGGYDIRSDRVRTLSYLCMCGSAAADIATDLGLSTGARLTERAIQDLSGRLALRVNDRVGARLLSTAAGDGLSRFGRVVPLLGGFVSAGVNAFVTNQIGDIARDMFVTEA